jgi:hypothetical protein
VTSQTRLTTISSLVQFVLDVVCKPVKSRLCNSPHHLYLLPPQVSLALSQYEGSVDAFTEGDAATPAASMSNTIKIRLDATRKICENYTARQAASTAEGCYSERTYAHSYSFSIQVTRSLTQKPFRPRQRATCTKNNLPSSNAEGTAGTSRLTNRAFVLLQHNQTNNHFSFPHHAHNIQQYTGLRDRQKRWEQAHHFDSQDQW